MGIASVAGGSILKAQADGAPYSRSTKLQMEKLPYSGLVKVVLSSSFRVYWRRGSAPEYSVRNYSNLAVLFSKTFSLDGITPDSAATGTAYLCGVKTNNGMLGMNGAVNKGDCAGSLDELTHVESIIAWAQANDMWTGGETFFVHRICAT